MLKLEMYLGDGVYASYDGYNILLDLRAQDNTVIVLEPATLQALDEFRKRAAAYQEKARS